MHAAERFVAKDAVAAVMSRYAQVRLSCDTSRLSPADRRALVPLARAASLIDRLFLRQQWNGNAALYARLRSDRSAGAEARLRCWSLNKGPWSPIAGHQAFLDGVPPRKPPGAGFYPEDVSRDEIERWLAALPDKARQEAASATSIVLRDGPGLAAVRYSSAYAEELRPLTDAMREAARATDDASLAAFLDARSKAFLSDRYAESEAAWIALDGSLEVTIGPYETYNDELLGMKASFEAYIAVRDDEETARLAAFARWLQDYPDTPRGTSRMRLRVVHQLLAAGDAAHGIHATAFTLPNDPAIAAVHGTKRVLLKNVQEAKFRSIVKPIAERIFAPALARRVSFEPFFAHALAHELMHGAAGRTEGLRELHAPLEEAKADALGVAALQFGIDRALVSGTSTTSLCATFIASAIRTVRFGAGSGHARGMTLQLTRLLDQGVLLPDDDGRLAIDVARLPAVLHELGREIGEVQRNGDREGAAALLSRTATLPTTFAPTVRLITAIPTEIDPLYERSFL